MRAVALGAEPSPRPPIPGHQGPPTARRQTAGGGRDTSEDRLRRADPRCKDPQTLLNSRTGISVARLRSQNTRDGFPWQPRNRLQRTVIVLKCFEILSMVSRETQAADGRLAR